METLIATVEAAILSEQNNIEYYEKKIEEDTSRYKQYVTNSQQKKAKLEEELAQLKEKLSI